MSLIRQTRAIVERRAGAFHQSESGAVALLCLAGTLIIFMTALAMFDSGWASQERVAVQTSADSAAFTNAAVKARALNSVAYMNVVKRSLVAMFEMYTGMMYYWRLTLDELLECLAEVTEELTDYNQELQEYDQAAQEFTENCGGGQGGGSGGGNGNGNGPGSGQVAGGGGDDDDDDCDDGAPEAPNAPATTICPGCESVEGTSPYEGVTFPEYELFGFNLNSIYESMVMTTTEQSCPEKDIFDAEAYGDWLLFSGLDAYELEPRPYGIYDDSFNAVVTRFIRINLRSLTDFQDMLIMLAPSWAIAEAEQRALFSHAKEMIPPEEPAALPLERGTYMDMCVDKNGHVDGNNLSGEALLHEISGNLEAHRLRSHPDSGFDVDEKVQAGGEYMFMPGCEAAKNSLHAANISGFVSALMFGSLSGSLSDILFGGSIGDDRGHMFPYHNTEDVVHDFYMTNRESKLTSGFAREKFGYMSDDYDSASDKVPEKYEAMACAETINLNPEYRMWRSSWAARIAPVEKCDPELDIHWK